jgi:hypothetical protein
MKQPLKSKGNDAMGKSRLLLTILVSFLLICCSDVQGTAGNHLYVESADGWTKHVEVPQGTTVSLVLFAKEEGNGYLNELQPDGSVHSYDHYFCDCYESLPFYANIPGQHVLSYIINGKESNSAVIDVTGVPTNYPPVVSKTGTYISTDYLTPYIAPISLGKGISSYPMNLHYNPVGSHVMNCQNGITTPRYASQYYFGREFSLGMINGNYPGTPFLTQFLADP